MPNRVIKESIKQSGQIDSLTWFEEVVFYRLIVTADDYGCMDGRAVLLKNELFPLKENVTRKSIESAIDNLASVGLLCKYTVSGKPYLYLPTWERHQRIRNQHRKYPKPPDSDLTVNCLTNDRQLTASCQSEFESEFESNPNIEANASCAEPKSGSAQKPNNQALFELPLVDGTAFPVDEAYVDFLSMAFPAVDVQKEIRRMIVWIDANPSKRKTKRGIKRFVTNWLSKEQDHGGNSMARADRPINPFSGGAL